MKKEDKPWDWSSRQVRLRYQMLAACLAYAVLVIFDHRTISLPFLSDVVSDINPNDTNNPSNTYKYITICAFAFAGSIYSILTFYYRSETEKVEQTVITEKHTKALETLVKQSISLEETIVENVNIVLSTEVQPEAQLFYQRVIALKKVLPELEKMMSDYSQIRHVINEYVNYITTAEMANFEKIISEANKNMNLSYSTDYHNHKERLKNGSDKIAEINRKLDSQLLLSISNDLSHDTSELIVQYMDYYRDSALEASKEVASSLEGMKKLIADLAGTTDILDKISDKAKKTTKIHNRERITFGYNLPYYAACIAVAITTVWALGRIYVFYCPST